MVLFMLNPNFKALGMDIFTTGTARRVTLPHHILVADWAGLILLKWREIVIVL